MMYRLALLGALGWAAGALSQTQLPTSHSGFDVASVKLNTRGGNGSHVQAFPGRLVMENFSIRRLILFAYGVQDYQISGDPSWIGSDYYDIQATAEGNASVKQMEGPMLQTLLQDRFKLAVHRETRQLPVYELTVAKGGAKLQRSKECSCIPYSADSPPLPSPAPGAPRSTFCGYPRLGVNGLNRTLDGAGVSMAVLATNLSRTYNSELGRNVIDGTGLDGTFDVHLKWTMEGPVSVGVPGDPGAAPPSAGPSILTAIQEQLGLKLESAKGPVEVLVIDHIERASAN
jgi:uncharacterized protein (TIGR03435 family)